MLLGVDSSSLGSCPCTVFVDFLIFCHLWPPRVVFFLEVQELPWLPALLSHLWCGLCEMFRIFLKNLSLCDVIFLALLFYAHINKMVMIITCTHPWKVSMFLVVLLILKIVPLRTTHACLLSLHSSHSRFWVSSLRGWITWTATSLCRRFSQSSKMAPRSSAETGWRWA